MDGTAGETHTEHTRRVQQSRSRREEEVMWQVQAAFRFGHYRTPEFDITPALGIALIASVIALIIHTSL
jgi:hypothetical protein